MLHGTSPADTYTLSHTTLFRSIAAVLPHRDMGMAAIAGEIDERLRHEGGAQPVLLGDRAHHIFEEGRSEEHTSELQSRPHLVCRLLLEKKKNRIAIQLTRTPVN